MWALHWFITSKAFFLKVFNVCIYRGLYSRNSSGVFLKSLRGIIVWTFEITMDICI